MSLSFVDDLGFIISGYLVKNIVKALNKVAQTGLAWKNTNAITYNIAKTEAVIFSRSYFQRLYRQITKTNIQIKTKSIKFNKKTTR